MDLIRNIIGFTIAIALIAFAVSNRQDTTLIYSPVHDALTVPLYLITLLFLGLGFVLGAFMVWVNGGSVRKSRRHQKKQIKALEKELEGIKSAPKQNTDAPAQELFPALPKASNE